MPVDLHVSNSVDYVGMFDTVEQSHLKSSAELTKTRYAKIENFDLSNVIDRYIREHEVDRRVAIEHAVEIKKFLAICSSSIECSLPIGMAGPVDEMWHTLLMFTREYNQLCAQMGGAFVHHVPDVDADDHEVSQHGYLRFVIIYNLAFESEPPSHIWPGFVTRDDGVVVLAMGIGGPGMACGGCGQGCQGACSQCSSCSNQGCSGQGH